MERESKLDTEKALEHHITSVQRCIHIYIKTIHPPCIFYMDKYTLHFTCLMSMYLYMCVYMRTDRTRQT